MQGLEEAIRDHLALKARTGADPSELAAVEANLFRPSEQGFGAAARTPAPLRGSRTSSPDPRLVRPATLAGAKRRGSAQPRPRARVAPQLSSPSLATATAHDTVELPVLRPLRRRERTRSRRAVAAGALLVALGVAAAAVGPLASRPASHTRAGASGPLGTTGSPAPVRRLPPARVLQDLPVFPFRPSPALRRPTPADMLPSLWADGLLCSSGCRPVGAIDGWPLRPFHRQHALRAGLNERRAGSLHEGLDIQARDGQRVYAIQPGYAHILVPSGGEARVRIGNFIYWHVAIAVKEGQYVKPYSTLVGRVNRHGYGHLHLSEVTASGAFLNPLRPGGRVLSPWSDTAAPVIGRPRVLPDGHVLVKAFDPQSFNVRTTYETPVLAPAGLAYRVFNAHGGGYANLHWAVRSNRMLPGQLAPELYAPDAKQPGFSCFATRLICKPDWDFVLAGGLAPRLGGLGLGPGLYRLSVYAWDYAGNVTARDAWFRVVPGGLIAAARAA